MIQQYCFVINKLIRDKLPAIVAASGAKMYAHSLSEEEYRGMLDDKLLEECKEVISALSKEEKCEELADVLEVMLAIGKLHGINFTDICAAADKKRLEKGGFDNRTYVSLIAIPEGSPVLEYYRDNVKYPEVTYN